MLFETLLGRCAAARFEAIAKVPSGLARARTQLPSTATQTAPGPALAILESPLAGPPAPQHLRDCHNFTPSFHTTAVAATLPSSAAACCCDLPSALRAACRESLSVFQAASQTSHASDWHVQCRDAAVQPPGMPLESLASLASLATLQCLSAERKTRSLGYDAHSSAPWTRPAHRAAHDAHAHALVRRASPPQRSHHRRVIVDRRNTALPAARTHAERLLTSFAVETPETSPSWDLLEVRSPGANGPRTTRSALASRPGSCMRAGTCACKTLSH